MARRPKVVRDLPEVQAEGRRAYEQGIRTVEGAKLANPYQGFGNLDQHTLFVNWNRGWNDAHKGLSAPTVDATK